MGADSKKEQHERQKKLFIDIVARNTKLTGVCEYYFARPARMWRSDVAWPEVRVALEIDGGTWVSGRHNNPSSVLKDYEKGNGYAARGWLVFHAPWKWIEQPGELARQVVQAIGDRLQEAKHGHRTD